MKKFLILCFFPCLSYAAAYHYIVFDNDTDATATIEITKVICMYSTGFQDSITLKPHTTSVKYQVQDSNNFFSGCSDYPKALSYKISLGWPYSASAEVTWTHSRIGKWYTVVYSDNTTIEELGRGARLTAWCNDVYCLSQGSTHGFAVDENDTANIRLSDMCNKNKSFFELAIGRFEVNNNMEGLRFCKKGDITNCYYAKADGNIGLANKAMLMAAQVSSASVSFQCGQDGMATNIHVGNDLGIKLPPVKTCAGSKPTTMIVKAAGLGATDSLANPNEVNFCSEEMCLATQYNIDDSSRIGKANLGLLLNAVFGMPIQFVCNNSGKAENLHAVNYFLSQ